MSARAAGRWAAPAAYVLLGATLVATRTIGLGSSLWHDEVFAVVEFIRPGPGEILTGPELSHELFGIFAWATTSLVGESELALRAWSVVPFLAGVAVVTAWLHARLGAVAGISFLFFATASPLLLDISRQARGYGLAFLAMGVLLVGALEATRTGRWWGLAAFNVAGVVGTWTLPQLGLAFAATGVVLLTDSRLRARAALSLGLSAAAIIAWYAPHVGEVRDASQIEDGVRIGVGDVLVSPFHHVLIPALIWIDGTVVSGTLTWMPLALLALTVMAYSPLLREARPAFVVCTGTVVTLVVLWVGQAYVIPRYLSYLLVPLFVLLATGMAEILGRLRTRPSVLGTLASALLVGLAALSFLGVAFDVVRYPREAYRDAVRTIEREAAGSAAVLAYMRNTDGLDFYLARPVRDLRPEQVEEAVCGSPDLVVFVMQPFGVPDVELPCLGRSGVERFRHRQYARGGEMNVWIVPPG